MSYRLMYKGGMERVTPCPYRSGPPYECGRDSCNNGECPGCIDGNCQYGEFDIMTIGVRSLFRMVRTKIVKYQDTIMEVDDGINVDNLWRQYCDELTVSEHTEDGSLADMVEEVGLMNGFAIWADSNGVVIRLVKVAQ